MGLMFKVTQEYESALKHLQLALVDNSPCTTPKTKSEYAYVLLQLYGRSLKSLDVRQPWHGFATDQVIFLLGRPCFWERSCISLFSKVAIVATALNAVLLFMRLDFWVAFPSVPSRCTQKRHLSLVCNGIQIARGKNATAVDSMHRSFVSKRRRRQITCRDVTFCVDAAISYANTQPLTRTTLVDFYLT